PSSYWVPGAWIAGPNEFHWQPGHWSPAQPDWVWVPQHYAWTPGGCLYVAGYWDYPLPSRGTLFAPVYFTAPVYQQPAYVFSPMYVVDVVPLLVNLWIRPAYGHYYFGDFYGAQYAS